MKVKAFSFLWLKYICAEFHIFPPFLRMQSVRRCYKVLHNQPEFHLKNQFAILWLFPIVALYVASIMAHGADWFFQSLYKGVIVSESLPATKATQCSIAK